MLRPYDNLDMVDKCEVVKVKRNREGVEVCSDIQYSQSGKGNRVTSSTSTSLLLLLDYFHIIMALASIHTTLQ